MQYDCPRCSHRWETDTDTESEATTCPRCGAGVRNPTHSAAPDETVPATALELPPEPPVAPTVLPFALPLSLDSPEYAEEKLEELRERRRFQREREREEREDRVSNTIGTIGFALSGTAVLVLLSGALFSKQLTTYAWFMVVLSFPLVLAGLPCSIIGGLRIGRVRSLAWVGTGIGTLLLLLGIPGLILFLLGKP